jgi:outer membrane protein TolC
MTKRALTLGFLCILSAAARAQAALPEFSLGLTAAESQAEAHSPSLQAKQFELAAAQARADAQAAPLAPVLSLEGTWHYASVVPELHTPIPGFNNIALGDHVNYSVGPQLTWNLWDSGGTYYAWRAARSQLLAKQQDLAAARRELALRTRLTYFQTQLALSQVRLLSDALRLSLDEYRDIQAQAAAGASSRIDTLAGHQEVLNDQLQLRRARTALAGALRDLLNLTGGGQGLDVSWPLDGGQARDLPSLIEAPTVWVTLDPLEQSLARLAPAGEAKLDPDHPQARELLELADAAWQAAAGLSSGHWPRVQVYGRVSLDYPNGPVLERIQQDSAGVNASWTLWAFGRVVNQVAEQEGTARATERQAQQVKDDLEVAWQKAHDQLRQQRGDLELDAQAVKETADLARLIFQTYQVGRASHLEVETANYRALGAKIQQVFAQVQSLIELATLESLAVPAADAK